MRTMTPLAERFWPKVRMTHTCWIWTASTASGYGQIGAGGRGNGNLRAHRVAYELMVGPIPEGLQIDHLCRNRRCVNPAHLEPVTAQENMLRAETTVAGRNAAKTHCVNGHEFNAENTWRRTRREGGRQCRVCQRERRR